MQPELSPVRLEGPVLVFGGPYGNLQATQAVLNAADQRRISAANIICTGDLAAYCAKPCETITLIREAGIHVVMGNCDEQLGNDAQDCACGYAQGSTCDLLSAQWYAYANSRLTDDDRSCLRKLPRRLDVIIGGARLAVIHGSVRSINAYVFNSTPVGLVRAELALAATDGVIGGHSGLPFARIVDDRLWLNAGVVGMPANDGTPRIWYSVLTPLTNGIQVEFSALHYDVSAAQSDMTAAGLPACYRDSLATGIWPSNDVLLATEREAEGVALAPPRIVFEASGHYAKPTA